MSTFAERVAADDRMLSDVMARLHKELREARKRRVRTVSVSVDDLTLLVLLMQTDRKAMKIVRDAAALLKDKDHG